jgi:hypothetical protein
MTLTMQAQSQQTITDSVLKYTQALCEALTQNYIDYSIRRHQLILDTFTGIGDYLVIDDEIDIKILYKERAYHQFSITELKAGKCDYSHIIESGSKYHKIIQVIDNGPNRMGPSRSVHAFVDKKTGEIYKSAGWKSPAKGVRFDLRLIKDREWLLENADWSGGYLYK